MAGERAQELISKYENNNYVMHHVVDDVSHDESLVQTPFEGGNCLNWVLGHVLASRDAALHALTGDQLWPVGTLNRYRRGSPPLTTGREARSFAEMVAELDISFDRLRAALEESSDEALEHTVDTDFGPRPLHEHIAGLHWHETFHLGQLDMLKTMIVAGRFAADEY